MRLRLGFSQREGSQQEQRAHVLATILALGLSALRPPCSAVTVLSFILYKMQQRFGSSQPRSMHWIMRPYFLRIVTGYRSQSAV